jgi:hypothetical protein
MAATVAIAAGTGWMANATLRAPQSGPDFLASPTRIVYDTMRGEDAPPVIQNQKSGSEFVLIEVGVPTNAEHVELEFEGHAPSPLVVSADGFVSFLVKRSEATKGHATRVRYRLEGREMVRNLDLTLDNGGARQ